MMSPILSTQSLADSLDDENLVIVDCRFDLMNPGKGRAAYIEFHIPGAVYAHLDEDLSSPVTPDSGRHPLPDPQSFARQLAKWGIGSDTRVVAYDDQSGAIAGRLWWMLHWLGHKAVQVLDGGLKKWQREGRALASGEEQNPGKRFHCE